MLNKTYYELIYLRTHDALLDDYHGKPLWIITRYVPEKKRKIAYKVDQNLLDHFNINLNVEEMLYPEDEWDDPTDEELDAFADLYTKLQTKKFGEYVSNNCTELPGIVIVKEGPSEYGNNEYGGEYYIEDNKSYTIL